MSDHLDRVQANLENRTLKAQKREAMAAVARKCLAEGLTIADTARRLGVTGSGVSSLLKTKARR